MFQFHIGVNAPEFSANAGGLRLVVLWEAHKLGVVRRLWVIAHNFARRHGARRKKPTLISARGVFYCALQATAEKPLRPEEGQKT